MSVCATCAAPNQNAIEAVGVRALQGHISWREATKELGLTHHAGLKNHMDKHYVAAALTAVEDEMTALIEQSTAELIGAMRSAPPEVKPLYAAAVRNLQGLQDTKPSQQHLIQALKTIQEMTGMKQEQRMMLQFAEAMFAELPTVKQSALSPPLPVLDAVVLDESSFASVSGPSPLATTAEGGE